MQWIYTISVCLYRVDGFWIMNVYRERSYHLGGMKHDDMEYMPGCKCSFIPHKVQGKNSTQVGCGGWLSDFPGTEVPA